MLSQSKSIIIIIFSQCSILCSRIPAPPHPPIRTDAHYEASPVPEPVGLAGPSHSEANTKKKKKKEPRATWTSIAGDAGIKHATATSWCSHGGIARADYAGDRKLRRKRAREQGRRPSSGAGDLYNEVGGPGLTALHVFLDHLDTTQSVSWNHCV